LGVRINLIKQIFNILIFFLCLLLSVLDSANAKNYVKEIDDIKNLPLPSNENLDALRDKFLLKFNELQDPESQEGAKLFKEAYSSIVDLMLSDLSTPQQDLVRKILDTNLYKQDPKWARESSNFDWRLDRITIVIPDRFWKTFILHVHIIHELAHAIQFVKSPTSFSSTDVDRDFGLFKSDIQAMKLGFYMERHAISWEWLLLHSLPQNMINFMVEEVSRMDSKFLGNASLEKNMLKFAHLSRREYLKAWWKEGRYSFRSIGKDVRVLKWGLVGSGTIACSLIFGASILEALGFL
jgi:hypothetical protein